MRVVGREEFMTLPNGTVYMRYRCDPKSQDIYWIDEDLGMEIKSHQWEDHNWNWFPFSFDIHTLCRSLQEIFVHEGEVWNHGCEKPVANTDLDNPSNTYRTNVYNGDPYKFFLIFERQDLVNICDLFANCIAKLDAAEAAEVKP